MPTIKFTKEKDKTKQKVEGPEGVNLRWIMQKNGVEVYEGIHQKVNCGGHGRCGACRFTSPRACRTAAEPTTIEKLRTYFSFFAIGNEDVVRLSCQTKVHGDITVVERPEMNWHGDERKINTNRASNVDQIP
jgi:ferredoxin